MTVSYICLSLRCKDHVSVWASPRRRPRQGSFCKTSQEVGRLVHGYQLCTGLKFFPLTGNKAAMSVLGDSLLAWPTLPASRGKAPYSKGQEKKRPQEWSWRPSERGP